MAEATWWVEVECPEVAAGSLPGRFVMLGFGLENTGPPFLPRPFSVGWRGDDGRLGFLVRVFGSGTRRLAALRPGDSLLVLGPLGTAFRTDPGTPTICVAGGVGLAPFLFLAAEERARGRDVRLVYGERTAARVFDRRLLQRLTAGPAEVWTEDGSAGRRGTVLEALSPGSAGMWMGCGPAPMLRALAALARQRGRPLQVSVEEHMGCGVGTCQGCVVPGADGRWIKACVEGPVFDAARLAWP